MKILLAISVLILLANTSYAQNLDANPKKMIALQLLGPINIQAINTKDTAENKPVYRDGITAQESRSTSFIEHYQYITIDSFALVKGTIVQMQRVSFEPGTHYFTENSYKQIDYLSEILKKHPTLKIEIRGHICCKNNGEDGFDPRSREKDLSVRRAEQVYIYLTKKGIKKNRLQYHGYGSLYKIYPNDFNNQKAAKLNRRVEFKIIAVESH